MKIIVLGGCGAMGSEATRDLARTSEFEEIVIADADLERAQGLATELGGGRVRAIQIDASDEAALTKSLRGFEVLANCTTYHFGLIAARSAINARVNYLDLGGLYNTPRQLEMDEDARRAGVTLCLGCGATPGVTNLMARAAADQLDQVDEVHIAFASFRSIAPSPGLLDTVLDEFSASSRRFFWQAGKFIETPAFSGKKQIRFAAPVGEIETFYVPHSETHTIPRFLGKGVRLVDVRGTWRPEIMRALRTFADLGLTGEATVDLDGQTIPIRKLLRAHILKHAADFCGEGEWAFLLNAEVLGRQNGQPSRIEYVSRHPLRAEWGTSATGRMTGIPASIAAQKLARGEVSRTGVLAPEACFDPPSFFAELGRRGIIIEQP
ncbi:MAG TPA: saccharopine dehydrogenase NADP-binding domain-containing protein [Pyrinomonadaceae bacterium]